MNRPEVYHKSVQILYDAYFNDTLKHGDCTKCAVGNLLAAAVANENIILKWYIAICYSNHQYDSDQLAQQIALTGYSYREIRIIENAFEACPHALTKSNLMFNGLVAVLEALKEIHEVTDEDLIQANHKRFKDHHERKLQTV